MFVSVHDRARSWWASFQGAAVASSFVKMVVHVPSAFVTLSYAIVHHGGRVILQVQTLLPQRRSFGLAENVCALAFISHSFRDRGSRNHQSPTYILINRQCICYLTLTAAGVCYPASNWIHFICICRWLVDDLLVSGVAFLVVVVALFLVRVRAVRMM